jgi:hypothetical protein
MKFIDFVQHIIVYVDSFWTLINMCILITEIKSDELDNSYDVSDLKKSNNIVNSVIFVVIRLLIMKVIIRVSIIDSFDKYIYDYHYQDIEGKFWCCNSLCQYILTKIMNMLINPLDVLVMFVIQPIIYVLIYILVVDTYKRDEMYYVKCSEISKCNFTIDIITIEMHISAFCGFILVLFCSIVLCCNNKCESLLKICENMHVPQILVCSLCLSALILYLPVIVQIFDNFHIQFIFPPFFHNRVELTFFVSNILTVTNIVINIFRKCKK